MGGLVFYNAHEMNQWGGHLTLQSCVWHGGFRVRNFLRFRVEESTSRKELADFRVVQCVEDINSRK
jgi:hypothetical protein